MMMTEAELIATATALAGEFRTSADCSAGGVAAAIMSASGRVYTGICVDTQCSMGFCAEHAAVAEMLKARESEIVLVVAVAEGGKGGFVVAARRNPLTGGSVDEVGLPVPTNSNRRVGSETAPRCWPQISPGT